MNNPQFFGYGSLVNRQTHNYPDARTGTVSGWRRIWQPTNLRGLCFLSVRSAPGHEIQGLIALVPGNDWAALDLRERAYARQRIVVGTPAGQASAQIYRTEPEHHAKPDAKQPILLSYLDTVIQGFHSEFGEDGVAQFFATTDGWSNEVLDDRAEPIYARATAQTSKDKARVDEHLDRLGAVRIPAGPEHHSKAQRR